MSLEAAQRRLDQLIRESAKLHPHKAERRALRLFWRVPGNSSRHLWQYEIGGGLVALGLAFALVAPVPVALSISLGPLFAASGLARLAGGLPAARVAALATVLISGWLAAPEFIAWNEHVMIWVATYTVGLVGFAFAGYDS